VTSRRSTTILAASTLVVAMSASMFLLRGIDRERPHGTLDEVLLISSPKFLKRASLGYTGLMADIYWTRAVQYFGLEHHADATQYKLLAPLLEITTYLDPKLLVAYEYGGNFLAPPPPGGAGEPERAVHLLEYGIQQNPDEWRLYMNLGHIYFLELKDSAKAEAAFERGSRVPNAHPSLAVMAALMAQHSGNLDTARALWTTTYQTATDKNIRDNAFEHLISLQVDQDILRLQDAVSGFQHRTGRLPANTQELATAEGWPGLPVDPDHVPYVLSSDGRVQVQNPHNFPFVTQGVPPGYKPPPARFVHRPD
jgi:tetratricopeptide (TPR) repeat protein